MIIDTRTHNFDVETSVENEEIEMGFDQSMIGFQFKMFISNIYSNPIGSIIREVTSNCFDSHVEANVVDKPVIIKMSRDDQNKTYLSFIDFGVGMSPDRIKTYATLMKSTSRNSNKFIGGWGIGGKCVLAYKRYSDNVNYDNSYNIITNFDGMKYVYCVYEGETKPKIGLLHKETTSEPNGTEVKIEIAKKDIDKFITEIKRQLFYFENIVFVGFDNYDNDSLNNYKIFEGNSFYYRGKTYSNYPHICLGKVAYPIDFSVIGYEYQKNIPIALKMPIGSIGVTSSRESLEYSDSTIKLITEKLKEAFAELKELHRNQFENIITLEDYLLNSNTNHTTKLKLDNNTTIECGDILTKKNNLKNNIHKLITDDDAKEYDIVSMFFSERQKRNSSSQLHRLYKENGLSIIFINKNDRIAPRMMKFIEQNYKNPIFLFNLHDMGKNFNENHIHSRILSMEKYLWATTNTVENVMYNVQEIAPKFYEFIEKYHTTVNLSEIVVPKDFMRKKRQPRSSYDKEYFQIQEAGGGYKTSTTIEILSKRNGLIFYTTKENIRLIDNLNLLSKYLFSKKKQPIKHNISFLVVPKLKIKQISKLSNAYPIEMSYDKLFKRKLSIMTSYMQILEITNIIGDLTKIPELSYNNLLLKINPSVQEKINIIERYSKRKEIEISNLFNTRYIYEISNNLMNTILKIREMTNIDVFKNLYKVDDNLLKTPIIEKLQKNVDEVNKYNEQMQPFVGIIRISDDDENVINLLKYANDLITK